MKHLFYLLALLVLAGCTEDQPAAPLQEDPPDTRPYDTVMCDVPPVANYARAISGFWQFDIHGFGHYTLGETTMLAVATGYGTWNPALSLRVQRDSGRVWFDAEPMLLPGEACTFSGTIMDGDSIVGVIHTYRVSQGVRRHGGYAPAVFYRQQ
jgi:hypothetical protein